jgi:phytoene synthase
LLLTSRRFGLQAAPLAAVLDGMAMDARHAGCADLPALEEYCRKVASAVGLACLPVFGASGELAERYADQLGLALQLTNVLRDLREDAAAGRCYVPRDWLADCAVAPEWLRGNGPDHAYARGGPVAALCARLHGAAAARFGEARAALAAMPRRQRRRLVPARVMAAVYGELLARLRLRGGDLRQARVRLHPARKLWLALRTALATPFA